MLKSKNFRNIFSVATKWQNAADLLRAVAMQFGTAVDH